MTCYKYQKSEYHQRTAILLNQKLLEIGISRITIVIEILATITFLFVIQGVLRSNDTRPPDTGDMYVD